MKGLCVLVLLAGLMLCATISFCAAEDVAKEQVIAIATEALKAKGIEAEGVEVIYDEGGKLWCEKAGFVAMEDTSPNHGILKQGFLKNYKIVYFDFVEPAGDIWVFVDKDTGEVLDVYQEK